MHFLFLVMLFAASQGFAEGFVLDAGRNEPLRPDSIGVLYDRSGAITIDEARVASWADINGGTFLGRVSYPVWFRMEISNNSVTNGDWIAYFYSDIFHERVDFYVLKAGVVIDHQITGSTIPFVNRSMKDRRLGVTFPAGVSANELVVRVQSTSNIVADVTFAPAATYKRESDLYAVFVGVFFGLISLLVLVSLILFGAFRDRSYLWYATFCSAMVLHAAIYLGYSDFFNGIFWTVPSAVLGRISIILPGICGTMFCRSFLMTHRHMPRLDKVLAANVCVALLNGPARFLLPGWIATGAIVGDICIFTGIIFILVAGVNGVRLRLPLARYFLASWSVFLVAVTVWLAGQYNLFAYGFWTFNAVFFGQIIEASILSFALIERVRIVNAERRIAEARANESDDLKTLLRVVSHDITNQLAIITGWANIARAAPDKASKAMERIGVAAANQAEIIRHVKAMRTLKDGKSQLAMEACDLGEAVEQVRLTFEDRLREKDLVLEVDLAVHGVKVMADHSGLAHTILSNIVSNAIKFSQKGGTISVQVARGGENVALSIRDRGIGIPVTLLAKVFSFSAETTRRGTAGERGTGYGMPLVKTYLERMGGTITIDSRSIETHPQDHGTLVTLTFRTEKVQLSA